MFSFASPPPLAIPNPPKWLMEEGGSGHQKGKKVVFNHIYPRRDQVCVRLVREFKKRNWNHKETPISYFMLLAYESLSSFCNIFKQSNFLKLLQIVQIKKCEKEF